MDHIPESMRQLLEQYVKEIQKIYGSHLNRVILYGSYARGDFRPDSDVDVMILLDLDDVALKDYTIALCDMTYDFNADHGVDIMPYAKSDAHFRRWADAYPFYANVRREGVTLYAA